MSIANFIRFDSIKKPPRTPRKYRQCCICGHKAKYRRAFSCRVCGIFQRWYESTITYTETELSNA